MELLMFLAVRAIFGTHTPKVLESSSLEARKTSSTPEAPKPRRDREARKLWQEWLEDDEWRVGKPD
jgi:hypothetical protein